MSNWFKKVTGIVKMKDLYEKTLHYENKIKDAGYNLVVHWGT